MKTLGFAFNFESDAEKFQQVMSTLDIHTNSKYNASLHGVLVLYAVEAEVPSHICSQDVGRIAHSFNGSYLPSR